MKLLDIDTLKKGTQRQQEAFVAIQGLRLFDRLRDFSPVLAGTIPLGIDTKESDLDIVCSAENLEEFAKVLTTELGGLQGFKLEHIVVKGLPTVVATFESSGFPFEIFAQTGSVLAQPAVVHMLIEARLLTFAPAEAKERIRALKEAGVETEVAFADCFDIEGDPYEELLKIARLPDHEILMIAHRFRFKVH